MGNKSSHSSVTRTSRQTHEHENGTMDSKNYKGRLLQSANTWGYHGQKSTVLGDVSGYRRSYQMTQAIPVEPKPDYDRVPEEPTPDYPRGVESPEESRRSKPKKGVRIREPSDSERGQRHTMSPTSLREHQQRHRLFANNMTSLENSRLGEVFVVQRRRASISASLPGHRTDHHHHRHNQHLHNRRRSEQPQQSKNNNRKSRTVTFTRMDMNGGFDTSSDKTRHDRVTTENRRGEKQKYHKY